MNRADFGPGAWLGIALLVLYWAWIWAFFARVRPRVMEAIARRMNVKVRESTDVLDAGTYTVEGEDASIPMTGAVHVADLVLLVLGTVGVAALIFIPAFLVAESGALLPLEGTLTGRRVALDPIPATVMSSASGKARLSVGVQNDGREPLRQCRAAVADYEKRNGYLHGSSAHFDLEPGQRRRVDLNLDAVQPPIGEHGFRVEVECASSRLVVRDAKLRVAP